MPLVLSEMLAEELAARAEIPEEDARRLLARVYRDGALPKVAFAGVRRESLRRARAWEDCPRVTLAEQLSSGRDPFAKYLVRLADGQHIETVRWPLEKPERITLCLSSQVGCALGCAFCATGTLGLARNLAPWEIIEQVRLARDQLLEGEHLHGLVFQGMGEPLANSEAVIRAIRVLSLPYGFAMDRRRMTVSTAGLPQGIRALAREVPEARLALSIGSARANVRESLMPIERRFPLTEVLEAAAEHTRRSGYAPMFSYTLIDGVTDTAADALALAELVQGFIGQAGVRPRLSLIPYNDVHVPSFRRPTSASVAAFRQLLRQRGVASKLRYSGGEDVGAACGQLVAGASPGEPAVRRATPLV